MFKDLSPINQLDAILSYLAENSSCSNAQIDSHFEFDRQGQYYFQEVLDRLVLDGFAEKYEYSCSITFNGRIFNSQGGYKVKSLNDAHDVALKKAEIYRLKTVDQNSEKNQIRLNRLTLWLAIGSTVLALIELGKILEPAYQYYCHCHFDWQIEP